VFVEIVEKAIPVCRRGHSSEEGAMSPEELSHYDEFEIEHDRESEFETESEPGAREVDRMEAVVRAVYSLLFTLAISLLNSVLFILVVFQLVYSLVTERVPNERVQAFGNSIVAYYYQMLRYLTHNDSLIPFPFSDFPAPVEPGRPAYAPARSTETIAEPEHAEV